MRQWEEVARKAFVVLGAVLLGVSSGSAALAAEDEGPAGYWSVSSGGMSGTAAPAAPTPRRLPTPGMTQRPARPSATDLAGSVENVSPRAARSGGLPAMRPMLAVDIDETLSITDYNSLLWGIGKDESRPLPGAQATLGRLAASFDIVYVTARSRSLKDETERWLNRHGFPNGQVVTSPTLGDFIFQGDFKRKAMQKLRREHPNLVVGIGDKVKDGQAYRTNRMVSVIVNPWRDQKYHADDVVLADWSAVSEFFQANHDVLSDPRLLNEALNGGRLSLNLSSEAREYQGQS